MGDCKKNRIFRNPLIHLPAIYNASFLALSSQGGEEVTALAAPTTNLTLVIHGLLQTLIAVSGKAGCIL